MDRNREKRDPVMMRFERIGLYNGPSVTGVAVGRPGSRLTFENSTVAHNLRWQRTNGSKEDYWPSYS
jgi:hypothetical protein